VIEIDQEKKFLSKDLLETCLRLNIKVSTSLGCSQWYEEAIRQFFESLCSQMNTKRSSATLSELINTENKIKKFNKITIDSFEEIFYV
jgi:hypothetical protein